MKKIGKLGFFILPANLHKNLNFFLPSIATMFVMLPHVVPLRQRITSWRYLSKKGHSLSNISSSSSFEDRAMRTFPYWRSNSSSNARYIWFKNSCTKKVTHIYNGPGPGQNYGETAVFMFCQKAVFGPKILFFLPKNTWNPLKDWYLILILRCYQCRTDGRTRKDEVTQPINAGRLRPAISM